MNYNKKYSDEELLNELKNVFEKGKYISKSTINEFGKFKDHLYYKRFGTLEKAMELIGIDLKNNKENKIKVRKSKPKNLTYTRKELIDMMNDYYSKYGYPKTRDFNNNKDYPTLYVYRQEFGSLENALYECGIEIPVNKQWLYNREEYSEEYLLKIFKEKLYEKLESKGELLKDDDIDDLKDMPSAGCYYKKFGTLDNVYKLIGIDKKKFNNDKLEMDMKEKYIEIKSIIGRVPNSKDLDRFSRNNTRYYGITTYLNHFNSIGELNILMGDKPTRNWTKDLTDEELLNTLIELKNDLGIVPNQKEVELCDYCGSIVSYIKRFGSFVNAIRKARMIPRSKKEPLITPKGNVALSGYEYKFMLVLERYNIPFEKEEFYKKYIKDFDKNYRFDFTLNVDNQIFFVEIFGITGNQNYENKTKEKIELCNYNKLKLIELYPNDIGFNDFGNIYKLLINKMKEMI